MYLQENGINETGAYKKKHWNFNSKGNLSLNPRIEVEIRDHIYQYFFLNLKLNLMNY